MSRIKKIFKNNIKLLILIIIMLISGIGVYAATIQYDSANVGYDNANSDSTSTNVQDAIDELDRMCTSVTNCPNNMTCKKNTPICRRANTLHTETCSQSSNHCAEVEGNGNTITYGSLGTSGVLTTGDAFDCDVNGDGTYDAANERFYYVSDYYDTTTKKFNSEYAILIYYTNTKNGEASTEGATYYTNDSYSGPINAARQLPTTSTWNNVSLYKTNRQILTRTNSTSISGFDLPVFSYEDKAARLITYQEIINACFNAGTFVTSVGGLNNCKFLFEKTKYSSENFETVGIRLENPYEYSNNARYTDFVNAKDRKIDYCYTSDTVSVAHGVRPTIEIQKSDIFY